MFTRVYRNRRGALVAFAVARVGRRCSGAGGGIGGGFPAEVAGSVVASSVVAGSVDVLVMVVELVLDGGTGLGFELLVVARRLESAGFLERGHRRARDFRLLRCTLPSRARTAAGAGFCCRGRCGATRAAQPTGDATCPAVRLVGGDSGAATSELVLRQPGENHGDVAGPLADPRGTPAGTRAPPRKGLPLVGEAGGDVRLLWVDPVVVAGVGGSGMQDLADHLGNVPVAELEDLRRPLVVLAPNEVEHLARLVGRHPRVPDDRPRPRSLIGLDTCHVIASPPVPGRRGSGTSASARTRPACGPPWTR